MVAAKYWTVGTMLLLLYGLVKEFRPSVPYLNLYLVNGSSANLTDEILYGQVYPVWTYTYLAMLIPVLMLTDWLAYKPIIISEAMSLAAVWALLLWGKNVLHMQVMQAFFGWASAAEVAYFSYVYVAVAPAAYQRVTSWIRMATLFGKCAAYFVGQLIMVLKPPGALKLINYISFASVCLAAAVAALTPNMGSKKPAQQGGSNEIYDKSADDEDGEEEKAVLIKARCGAYFSDIYKNLRESYRDKHILKWSVWWAMSTCLWTQVLNYIQVLWSEIDLLASKESKSGFSVSQDYNGLTETVTQLLGALAAYSVQFITVDWTVYGEFSIGVLCCAQALFLFLSASGSPLLAVYAFYVAYCVLYQAGITMATYNVAKNVKVSAHGLIFGANTFIAMALQAALTFVAVDYRCLNLPIFTQFYVYAGLQSVLSLLFLVMGSWTFLTRKNRNLVQINDDEDTSLPHSAVKQSAVSKSVDT